MEKNVLIGITDIEKLNVSELLNIKGGANSSAEDSEHHDSDNNDTFNGPVEPITSPETPDSPSLE